MPLTLANEGLWYNQNVNKLPVTGMSGWIATAMRHQIGMNIDNRN